MKKIRLLTIFIITILSSGCLYEDSYNYLKTNVQEEENSKFTLTNDSGNSDDFWYSITGDVTNNTSSDYSYVSVEFNVYDSDGNQIGNCFDSTNNLEAHGTWKIEALCDGDVKNIKSYKLIEFSSF